MLFAPGTFLRQSVDVVFAVTRAILDWKETLVALRVLRNFSNTAHVERVFVSFMHFALGNAFVRT